MKTLRIFSITSLTTCMIFSAVGCGKSQIPGFSNVHVDVRAAKSLTNSPDDHLLSARDLFYQMVSPPATVPGFNCMALNATGSGIPTSSNLGIVSGLVSVTSGGTMSLLVPEGANRLFQVIGLLSNVGCPSGADITSIQNFPLAVEMGRKSSDIFGDTDLTIYSSYNSQTAADIRGTTTGGGGGGGGDTTGPTLSSLTPATSSVAAYPSTIVATFAEAMTALNASKFVLSGTCTTLPTVSGVVMSSGNTVATATLTGGTCTNNQTLTVTVDPTTTADSSGNAGTGSALASTYTLDTTTPTLSSLTPATSSVGSYPTTIVATFSKAIIALDASKFVVSGTCTTLPTVSGVVMSSGNTVATATLTGGTCTNSQTLIVTVDPTTVADGVGNSGTGSAVASTYTVDTAGPTLSSLTPTTSSVAAYPSTIVATFSEAMTALDASKFVLTGTCTTKPTVSGVVMSSGNTVATATLSGGSCSPGQTLIVTVTPSANSDAAGNAGTGSTRTATYTLTGPAILSFAIPTKTVACNTGGSQTFQVNNSGAGTAKIGALSSEALGISGTKVSFDSTPITFSCSNNTAVTAGFFCYVRLTYGSNFPCAGGTYVVTLHYDDGAGNTDATTSLTFTYASP